MIEHTKSDDELISLYTDINNTTKFEVGYIADFNEDDFILERISPEGKYDGYLFGKTQSIYRVELDSIYLNKILKLMKYNGMTRRKNSFEHNNLLLSFMKFAYEDKKILSIELFESDNQDIVGRVDKFDSDHCTIMQTSESGELNGYSSCKLGDISFIVCDSEDQQIIAKLNHSIQNT